MTRSTIPTLDDVAAQAGVSTATISRALNTPDKVAETTRKKIDAAIAALGYVPHFGGQALASNRTRTVGAIVPTLANSMFAEAMQAFQERLAKAGVTLLIASSGYDPAEEQRQIRALMGRGADGLLLVGTARPDETRSFLEQRRVPHVLTWCYGTDGAHYAGFNSYEAAKALAHPVLGMGHRRVAVIAAYSAGNDRARDRLKGVQDAADAAGAKVVRVVETAYGVAEGRDAFDEVMRSSPTIIFCANDVLAAGAVSQARLRGLRVPEDVSITGFDDIELATIVDPPLTTIRVPHQKMGHAAAEILLALMAGETAVPSVELETEVVLRGSLAPPAK